MYPLPYLMTTSTADGIQYKVFGLNSQDRAAPPILCASKAEANRLIDDWMATHSAEMTPITAKQKEAERVESAMGVEDERRVIRTLQAIQQQGPASGGEQKVKDADGQWVDYDRYLHDL